MLMELHSFYGSKLSIKALQTYEANRDKLIRVTIYLIMFTW